jgi:hypothetical protein
MAVAIALHSPRVFTEHTLMRILDDLDVLREVLPTLPDPNMHVEGIGGRRGPLLTEACHRMDSEAVRVLLEDDRVDVNATDYVRVCRLPLEKHGPVTVEIAGRLRPRAHLCGSKRRFDADAHRLRS